MKKEKKKKRTRKKEKRKKDEEEAEEKDKKKKDSPFSWNKSAEPSKPDVQWKRMAETHKYPRLPTEARNRISTTTSKWRMSDGITEVINMKIKGTVSTRRR